MDDAGHPQPLRCNHIGRQIVNKNGLAGREIEQLQRQFIDRGVGLGHADFAAHHHQIEMGELGQVGVEPKDVRLIGVADHPHRDAGALLQLHRIGQRCFVAGKAGPKRRHKAAKIVGKAGLLHKVAVYLFGVKLADARGAGNGLEERPNFGGRDLAERGQSVE